MTPHDPPRPVAPAGDAVVVDEAAERALRALLRIDGRGAARIRAGIGHRRRPRPQAGPTADYGERASVEPVEPVEAVVPADEFDEFAGPG